MIVESPAKARTITRLLGNRVRVLSSMGHVADLPKKGMSVDIENGFAPVYETVPGKRKAVAELRKAVADAGTVWLASDEDREGEAIAWHLARVLKLGPAVARRIVFHEITRPAIEAALTQPRQIDQHLVDAQQARRVLDRLVGYELSPVLWKKVLTGLSAGRVQSVAVRLVVEREREIGAFKPAVGFRVVAGFRTAAGAEFPARLEDDCPTAATARGLLERLIPARFRVEVVEQKPGRKSPRPPFTTSTLQQEASQKLGFSVKQTMALAQRLYEAGRISYMRTDSVTLSDLALRQAAEEITGRFGREYVRARRYKTKSRTAQEAHEAIRPTDFSVEEAGEHRNEQRLYTLIRRRALASQMADALVERTTATIAASTTPERFVARGEVVRFDGFLRVYGGDDDGEEKMLPPLAAGDPLELVEARARETFTRPPARYTEASLVKRLEELGIGRPSTYAPTISTIQDRGYVTRETRAGTERPYRELVLRGGRLTEETLTETTGAEKAKLFPTDVAGVVTDFLVRHFPEVIDYSFTARVEEELDEIARGEQAWQAMLGEFYGPFHADIVKAEALSRQEASRARELGTDPATGKPVLVRVGRYGPYVQIGTRVDEEKPRFASLRPGQRMEAIDLAQALELFKLPRKLGKTPDGEEVLTDFGRYGPYVKYGSRYVSIKGHDPMTIDLDTALRLVAEKKAADAEREIRTFEGSAVRVLRGRYGPYITDGTKNARVPKGTEPSGLTLEQCEKLLADAPEPRRRRTAGRKPDAAVKKPPARKRPPAKKKPAGPKPARKARGRRSTRGAG